MFPSILIVDDEPSILQSLSGLLSDDGFDTLTADNGYEALKVIDAESPDLVLLDIWMPGIDGLETLKEIKKENPFIQVIIITGHGTIETAVKATKIGAFDLIEKPLSIDKVIVSINNALNFRRLEEENRYLRKKTIEKHTLSGNSPRVMELKKQISIAAPSDTWVLIRGQNGTGKELVARSIHQLSPRADHPLIDVNCAAIPEDLIESELFGHEKGAFPGAVKRGRGKFELANNGTIFFDEIGDMSLKTQAKILRVLQEQKFQRMGGGRILSVNVRVIAATNKDLEKEIEMGNFRKDLYYRINVIPIKVPPLKNRLEDIPFLVDTFLDEFSKQHRSKKKIFSKDAIKTLGGYSWPGNVRELKNFVERLALMVEGDITKKSVKTFLDNPSGSINKNVKTVESKLFEYENLKEAKARFEKEFISKKLCQYDNNITKTANAIGVGQSYIHKKLKSYR